MEEELDITKGDSSNSINYEQTLAILWKSWDDFISFYNKSDDGTYTETGKSFKTPIENISENEVIISCESETNKVIVVVSNGQNSNQHRPSSGKICEWLMATERHVHM